MEIFNGEHESNPKKFALPVDSEHKSTEFRLFSVAAPHMRAFHLSWVSFFACFLSTFAASPLLPIIRDNMNLTATDISETRELLQFQVRFLPESPWEQHATYSGHASPRLCHFNSHHCTSSLLYFHSQLSSLVPTGSLLHRFLSRDFCFDSVLDELFVIRKGGRYCKRPVAGEILQQRNTAYNALSIRSHTQYRLDQIFGLEDRFLHPCPVSNFISVRYFLSWPRFTDGNYSELHKLDDKHKDDFLKVFYHAITNHRGWILALTYGYFFGVELTIDIIITRYFYYRFNVNLHTAGIIAASFGLANLFSRPGGRMLSDLMAEKFGTRGRLCTLWIVQTLRGIFCILLGKVGSLAQLGLSVAIMLIFSVFVQAACGLTFGVVPFVSRSSLGIVSGMTGSRGNIGAVLTQVIFFRGSRYSTEKGLELMGGDDDMLNFGDHVNILPSKGWNVLRAVF